MRPHLKRDRQETTKGGESRGSHNAQTEMDMEVKPKYKDWRKTKKEVDSWNAVTPDSGASVQREDRTVRVPVSRDASFDRGRGYRCVLCQAVLF